VVSRDSFAGRYLDRTVNNGDVEPVELIVSSMQGDDRLDQAKTSSRTPYAGISWDGIKATSMGTAYSYFYSEANRIGAHIELPEDYFAGLASPARSRLVSRYGKIKGRGSTWRLNRYRPFLSV